LTIAEEIRKTHQEILKSIEGLSAKQLIKKGAFGKWSGRDVLLHIAMWTGECIKGTSVWKTGHDYDWSYANEYLAFNEFWVKTTKHLTAEQVIQMLNLNYFALFNELASIDDELWKQRGGAPKWLKEIAVKHSRSHSAKLNRFRKGIIESNPK
jgi:hypothetical protein